MAKAKEEPIPRVIFDLSDDAKDFLTNLFVGQKTDKKTTSKPTKAEVQEEDAPNEDEVSLTSIREMITDLSREGKTTKIKALLATFKAAKAAELQESDYTKFYEKLKKL